MSSSDPILDEFLIEAGEIFDQLDLDFVALEKSSGDKKLIGSIFRAMHSLKGSSRFCAFRRLEKLTHFAESLLSDVRDGSVALTGDMISTLLRVSDRLREIIAVISDTRVEPEGEDGDLIAELEQHLGIASSEEAAPDPEVLSAPALQQAEAAEADALAPPRSPASADADSSNPGLSVPTTNSAAAPDMADEDELDDEGHVHGTIAPVASASQAAPAAREAAGGRGDALTVQTGKTSEVAAPVKVSVELLDTLMNLVSEMVLARNRLLSFAMNSSDVNFSGTVRTIDMITMELQERMMKTRMQPISQLWTKFPRLVRDVAQECGKRVELVQIGGETELDRTLIEGIRDPLVHIIRNSIDHGIESPATRAARGKRPEGTITLRAMHENGMVVVEISDDGGGIDIVAVGEKALAKGVVTAERLARLSDREILDLIFLPGFSTKDEITNVSGRGVGLDVVRNNVQQIGGTVDVSTSVKGTRFSLKIPLTLAIMPAVFVRCQDQRFAIPQNNLFEMVRQEPQGDMPVVEMYHNVPVFRLRNKLIPLLVLGSELGLSNSEIDPHKALNIVVVQAAEVTFGLVVDEVLFMQEVVVKPIGPLVKGINVYSGATILGDGRVSLIFDIAGLAVRSGLLSKGIDTHATVDRSGESTQDSNLVPMLLVDLESVQRAAIPLDFVDRLELIDGSRVEHRGEEDVVIYGDKIMSLVWVSSYVDNQPRKIIDFNEKLAVVVHMVQEQPIGLVVRNIHDITGVPPTVTMVTPPLRGFVGSTIVGDHVISILDVPEILRIKGLEAPEIQSDAGARYIGMAPQSLPAGV